MDEAKRLKLQDTAQRVFDYMMSEPRDPEVQAIVDDELMKFVNRLLYGRE